jgi:PAS domain S-box-containing protein
MLTSPPQPANSQANGGPGDLEGRAVIDRTLQVVAQNPTLQALVGGHSDLQARLPVPLDVALPAWAPILTPLLHDVITSGTAVERATLPCAGTAGDGQGCVASLFPVAGPLGSVLGVDLVVRRGAAPAGAASMPLWPEIALALDTMPVGVLLLDGATLGVRWANATYQTFLDTPFDRGHLRGRRLDEFIPYAEESGVAEIFRQVAATGQPYTNPEFRHEGFVRGTTFWRWSLLPIRRTAGPFDLLLVVTEITEQVQLRQEAEDLASELARERAQLDTLIAQLPIGLTIAEAPGGRLLLQNDRGAAVLGHEFLPAEGIADYQHYGALQPDGQPYPPEAHPLARALHGEVVQSELLTYRRGDGSLTRLEVSAAPVHDAAGQIILAVCTFQDVSAREQAAEALRLSEARFRALQETSIDGFMLLESVRDEGGAIVDFRWLYANGSAERIVGRPQTWFPGRRLLEEMPGNRAEGLFDAYVQVVETGEPWSTEIEYTHEGVNAYMRLVAARAGDGFAVTFADLSERRWAEERLRESEERFRSVFESIDEGFCIVECLFDDAGRPVDYRFLQANPAFERHTGLVGAVGHTARELVPGLEPFWYETYGRVALTGEAVRFEDHAEPMGRWFDVHASRVGDASRRQVAIVFADITERKLAQSEHEALLARERQAHRATEAALTQAEAATRERDLLISIAAHDLRTPLTAILGHAQLLQRRAGSAGLDERNRRTLATIVEQAERLNAMIAALLDLSRIQEGQLTIHHEPVDLRALTERVAAAVQATTTAHTLSLNLPEAPLHLRADPLRLEQVLHNLIGNAVKYSPDGGLITVAVAPEGRDVRIAVRDQGIGIPATALPHLFTRFYRAPNATEQPTSSLGIGLFIVRELVQAHGGSVTVESVEGAGSTFMVHLPWADTEELAR